jgi:nucleoside 2-deoxyribosyltransferase
VRRPRVYLAGPDVFFHRPAEHGERLKKFAAGRGLVGVFPLDAEIDLLVSPGTGVNNHALKGGVLDLA